MSTIVNLVNNVNNFQIVVVVIFVSGSGEQFSSSLFTLSTIANLVDNVNNCQIVVVFSYHIFVSVSGEQLYCCCYHFICFR